MIVIQLPNNNPHSPKSAMAVKFKGESLQVPKDVPVAEFCYCDIECDYVERVFASLTSDDYWKNDKSGSFIFRRMIPTDTVEMKLFKNGVEIATITDNTYGEFINGFANGNAEQQLYTSFVIDWKKVLQLDGVGLYQLKTTLDVFGSEVKVESQKFQLNQYSVRGANKTVRIESYHNGNVTRSLFDFTGLNVYNSYRIEGKLSEITPVVVDDSYLNTSYGIDQIQTICKDQWLLKTNKLPRGISVMLKNDSLLSNSILITDYNIINEDRFRRIPLYYSSIEKVDIGDTTRAVWEITFTDKVEDNRKRNN